MNALVDTLHLSFPLRGQAPMLLTKSALGLDTIAGDANNTFKKQEQLQQQLDQQMHQQQINDINNANNFNNFGNGMGF